MKINFTNKTFSFFLVLSLSFHLIVILFLIVSKSLPHLFKKDKNLLIQNTIRIDTIGLPDLPSKPKAKKEKRKTALIKKPKKNKEKIKKKRKEKQAQARKKEKLKENQAQKNREEKTSSAKNDKLNKGNKLSKGTKDGKENLTAQQLSEISIYANQIDRQIRAQWSLPKYLTDKKLTAQVEIKINKQGHITYKQILISSGNDLFDSFVLKAIENSEPYPPPPPGIQKFIKNGIAFGLSSRN
ncbi:MAG: energy transducer TonB [Oligoflexia bacterium]|nr:energy transducer TonB [Oligoflexia bacterium]